MNREDIIRMAREACMALSDKQAVGGNLWYWPMEYQEKPAYREALERFFHAAYAAGAAAEREACAKVCDDKAKETFSGQCQVWGDYFARVIRARGNK